MHIFVLLVIVPLPIVAGSECSLLKKGLSVEEKNLLLNYHNQKRDWIASGKAEDEYGLPWASKMYQLGWDDELAKLAQDHANTCPSEKSRSRHSKFGLVGQNCAYRSVEREVDRLTNLTELPELWWSNIKYLKEEKYKTRALEFREDVDKKYDSLARMIWGSTWAIGCGLSVFRQDPPIKRMCVHDVCIITMLVCNYAPAGNIHGQNLYKKGYSSFECGRNTKPSEEYPNLCQVFPGGPEDFY